MIGLKRITHAGFLTSFLIFADLSFLLKLKWIWAQTVLDLNNSVESETDEPEYVLCVLRQTENERCPFQLESAVNCL